MSSSPGLDPTATGGGPPGGPPGAPGGAPPGVPPGLVSNPNESRQINIIVASVICWLISVTFVGLRFYSRVSLTRNRAIAEDWLVVVALIFAGAMSGTFIAQAQFGFGKHLLDLSPANYTPMKMAEWLGMIWYVMSLVIIKVSICLLYLRILQFRHSRYAIWGLLTVVVVFALYGLYGIFTACKPLSLYWTFPPNTGACRPTKDWIINTSLHIATDIIMYILPLPLVLRIRAPSHQKLALYIILALGLFVCIVSIIRLWDFDRTLSSADISWEAASIAYWSLVETNATIVVACVMTLRPVIKRWFPRFWGSTAGTAGGRRQNYHPSGPPPSGSTGAAHGHLARGRELVTFGSAPSRPKRSHGLSNSTLRTIDDADGPLVPHPAAACIYTTTTTIVTATHSHGDSEKVVDTDGESLLNEQRKRVEEYRQQLQQQQQQQQQPHQTWDDAWPPRAPSPTHKP
ncbi:hypothetical protein VTJ83DRAFT_1855 [Remersonia thermophila]|uniref:Rhodopsin domain-containing protein n=1 Tax=Remersonia thermophila TaxID=72144 RepID=A0ABR4DH28_9PEZI